MDKVPKYKKGDKVRLLPNIVNHSIPLNFIGDIGVIRGCRGCAYGEILYVINTFNPRLHWFIYESEIEPVFEIGEQLFLFPLD